MSPTPPTAACPARGSSSRKRGRTGGGGDGRGEEEEDTRRRRRTAGKRARKVVLKAAQAVEDRPIAVLRRRQEQEEDEVAATHHRRTGIPARVLIDKVGGKWSGWAHRACTRWCKQCFDAWQCFDVCCARQRFDVCRARQRLDACHAGAAEQDVDADCLGSRARTFRSVVRPQNMDTLGPPLPMVQLQGRHEIHTAGGTRRHR